MLKEDFQNNNNVQMYVLYEISNIQENIDMKHYSHDLQTDKFKKYNHYNPMTTCT